MKLYPGYEWHIFHILTSEDISLTSFLRFSFVFRLVFFLFSKHLYLCNKKKITRCLEHMKLIFSWKKYFTRLLRSLVKYFFHSKINFICSRHYVISFIYESSCDRAWDSKRVASSRPSEVIEATVISVSFYFTLVKFFGWASLFGQLGTSTGWVRLLRLNWQSSSRNSERVSHKIRQKFLDRCKAHKKTFYTLHEATNLESWIKTLGWIRADEVTWKNCRSGNKNYNMPDQNMVCTDSEKEWCYTGTSEELPSLEPYNSLHPSFIRLGYTLVNKIIKCLQR